jgi:uncharacterized alpha/beta hydrolase family protein
MDSREKQIHRQSSLKTAVEYFKLKENYTPTLMEIVGVSMGFEAYVANGSYELLQTIQKKLNK